MSFIINKKPTPLISEDFKIEFLPDRYFSAWISETFLNPGNPFYNEEHDHLESAEIGVVWSTVENVRQGKQIVAQAELASMIGGSLGKWARARVQQQLYEWFGTEIDFLLTFDAHYFLEASDATFGAVVDHELYHCSQALKMGIPMFRKDGRPKFAMRAHDVEQFVGVVRRWGSEVSGVSDLISAAKQKPEIASADISAVCGACIS